ncbi:hypothetical protein CPB86DRAFT_795342 [Serendipita vermifera]|nr:hypothetical protein CPB86DRAFT_795342 [Serendipita vermifera]
MLGSDQTKRPSLFKRLFKKGNGNNAHTSQVPNLSPSVTTTTVGTGPNETRDRANASTKVIHNQEKSATARKVVIGASKPTTTTNIFSANYTNPSAIPAVAIGAGFTDTSDHPCPTAPNDSCDGGGKDPLSIPDGHHGAGSAMSAAYTSTSAGDTEANAAGGSSGYGDDSGGAGVGYSSVGGGYSGGGASGASTGGGF